MKEQFAYCRRWKKIRLRDYCFIWQIRRTPYISWLAENKKFLRIVEKQASIGELNRTILLPPRDCSVETQWKGNGGKGKKRLRLRRNKGTSYSITTTSRQLGRPRARFWILYQSENRLLYDAFFSALLYPFQPLWHFTERIKEDAYHGILGIFRLRLNRNILEIWFTASGGRAVFIPFFFLFLRVFQRTKCRYIEPVCLYIYLHGYSPKTDWLSIAWWNICAVQLCALCDSVYEYTW